MILRRRVKFRDGCGRVWRRFLYNEGWDAVRALPGYSPPPRINTAYQRTGRQPGRTTRMPVNGHPVTERSGAGLYWGREKFTAAGGVYRLCWCAATFPCSDAEDYKVDVGGLHVLGPSYLDQARTCVAGQTCQLENLPMYGALNLPVARQIAEEPAMHILILETCGAQDRARFTGVGGSEESGGDSERLNPPDAARTFSSVLGLHTSVVGNTTYWQDNDKSRLHSEQAWVLSLDSWSCSKSMERWFSAEIE